MVVQVLKLGRKTQDGVLTILWCLIGQKELIEETDIMNDVMGSDHCPVGLAIDI